MAVTGRARDARHRGVVLGVALAASLAGVALWWLPRRSPPCEGDCSTGRAEDGPAGPSTAPAQLTGLLANDRGLGQPGAEIRIGEQTTRSGPGGLFRVPHPGAGRTDVEVRARGFVYAARGGCCATLDLRGPGRDGLLKLRVHRPASIAGVVMSAGRPVQGATLGLEYEFARGLLGAVHGLRRSGLGDTNPRGRFELLDLVAGRVRVLATAGSRGAVGSWIDLRPGHKAEDYRLELRAMAAISGQVLSRDGQALAGARVILGDGDRWSARTDRRGRFRLDRVIPGTYSLRVTMAGFSPWDETGIALGAHAELIRVVRMEPLAGVAGRVIDPDGRGVVGATVLFARGDRERTVHTTGGGRFVFASPVFASPGDPSGMVATALHPGYAASEPVQVSREGELVLRLGPGGGLRGRVVLPGGRGVAGATVRLLDRRVQGADPEGLPTGIRAGSGEHGRFALQALRPGRYDLLATAPGRRPGVLRGVAVPAGPPREVEIILDSGARIAGVVRGPEDEPIGGAAITVWPSDPAGDLPRATARSDESGSFETGPISPGPARLRASGPGMLPSVVRVEVPDRGRKELSVHLRAAASARTLRVESIGAALRESAAGLVFTEVTRGSPAARAGVVAGDRLATIDFNEAAEMTPEEVAATIRTAFEQQATLEVVGPDGSRRSVYVSP